MRADLQLERLLYVLPVAARDGGARIDDLARDLDVTPARVLADLQAAMTRAYYHPAGTVEPFTILIEGDVVSVHAPREFQRPVRLSEREALALGLGLRALAAEAEQPRRAEIIALAARLESELTTREDVAIGSDVASLQAVLFPDSMPEGSLARDTDLSLHEVEYAPDIMLGLGDDSLRGIIADAIEQHRMLRITYLKFGDAAQSERRIAPYRLVLAEGKWYVAAHDPDRGGLRFFRLDRMLDAVIEEEAPLEKPEVDLQAMLQDGIAYHARDDVKVTVRYAGTIARWIAEQQQGEAQEDGSVVVTHNVADPGWFVSQIMQYGGAATVEAPVEARRWVSAAARRLAGG